jgi:putative transposase
VRKYRPHIKQRKEECAAKKQKPGYKPRRWVVERTHSWLNRFRKLLVSFEKTETSYLALLSLAAALICWRQRDRPPSTSLLKLYRLPRLG